MKTIGLIGGMSWESTATYYQVINQVVKQQLGGLHSAKCILYSVNFHEIEQYQANGAWDESAKILAHAAMSLEQAGADFIIICTNTMHKVVSDIQAHITIPIMHIAQATALVLKKQKMRKVALLGTKYTMEHNFYKQIIIDNGIEVMIPEQQARQMINDVIYHELCVGSINDTSKQNLLTVINKLAVQGAQGIILGCTEIGLLITQNDTTIPLFDTSHIHAQAAALQAIA